MYITPEQIFNATNGGLDVIVKIYPQVTEALGNNTKKFKIRDTERTPSASIKQIDGGIWVVTDFGGDQKTRNCIELVRQHQNCDYKQAITWIAGNFNIQVEGQNTVVNRATITKRPATENEHEGDYYFDTKESITENELNELFAKKVIEFYKHNYKDEWKEKLNLKCKDLNFSSLKSFTQIKNKTAIITESTDLYPIFCIDGGSFKKIYQPKNIDKGYRFRYTGVRPKDYIFNLSYVKIIYEKHIRDTDEELDNIIICSGDRDSLNVYALGYNVVWLNSETANLSFETFLTLKKMAKNVYNLPDIDATGKRQAHLLSMFLFELKTIELPDKLLEHKDWRGNPCKDVRDYLNIYGKKAFDKLVNSALPYQFWDVIVRDEGLKYQVNNTHLYNFLQKNGFFRFTLENEKEGYTYVSLANNTVKQIKPVDIKAYINNLLEERKEKIELRNTFYKSTQLYETSFSNLNTISIDFTDFDKESQYIFFNNKTWHITKDNIKEYLPADVKKYVWADEVIQHKVELKSAPFKITQTVNSNGKLSYDIEVLHNNCLFFNYLIQTSRIHWRKEFEEAWQPGEEKERLEYIEKNKFNIAGPKLSHLEIEEQKLHLINKIYAYGYLLHRYKDADRPWCVFAMDNKPSEEGESHGGTGKSIMFKSVSYFMQTVTLDGRNRRLTDNPFIYERVTEHTDYILIDDADQYLNFSFFFAPLTGSLTINPKFGRQFSLPYSKVPKFCITSNFTLRNLDPSTERRLLYTVFSDYYHYNTNNEYNETRSPKNDFGKNLFQDFDENEWNLFFNTAAYCCSAYLNYVKIEPPLNNVLKRNLITEMGASFLDWAEVYFNADRLNTLIVKKEAFDDFVKGNNIKHQTPQNFAKRVAAFCRYKNYVLNPPEMCDEQGRIVKNKYVTEGETQKRVTVEMYFIKADVATSPVDTINSLKDDSDDFPF